MPVKYIDVTASSDLFVPATRAFGDIAIVGKGQGGRQPRRRPEFTNPAAAVAAYPVARSVTDGVLNSTTTVTSATASFVASDVGRPVTGTGIPDGTTIVTVTNGTTIVLSAAATATATGVALTLGAKPNEHHRPRRSDRYRLPPDASAHQDLGCPGRCDHPGLGWRAGRSRQPQRADCGPGELAAELGERCSDRQAGHARRDGFKYRG